MNVMTYNFTVLMEQGEDGVFIAPVPALKSCYTNRYNSWIVGKDSWGYWIVPWSRQGYFNFHEIYRRSTNRNYRM